MIMIFDMPPHVTRIAGGIAGTAILIAVSCVAFAQPSPQRPGEVPYLNFPPVTIPGKSAPSPVPPSPPAGQRSKARAPAHRPPSAAGNHGTARRCAAITALGDAARCGAARNATGNECDLDRPE